MAGPDRYRATVSTASATQSQGLDGDVGWVTANNGAVVRLSGADLARLRRIAMRYRPLKERPANLQVVGIERVNGRDAYVTTAKIDATTTWTLYFDVVTGLLRRDDDYRDVNGVQLPYRVQTSDGAPYDTVTRTFVHIRRNVAVDDALFRPPAPR
jgi:hypothetical protein